jgi:hypothetical protein
MKIFTSLLALLLAVAVPVSVVAQPRVIGDLSDGALLGQIRNTAELQTEFSQQHQLLADASIKLGLTPSDFSYVSDEVALGRARYVEIPRHLSGMAGQHEGSPFAVHGVVIPAHVYGWEVDIERPAATLRVFMPNRCGNISYLLVPRPQRVASLPPAVHRQITAISAMPAVLATPAPEWLAYAPMTASDAAPGAPMVARAPHHFALLPWLALGLLAMALVHGGSVSTAPPPPVLASAPTPIPVHTICPSALIRR